MRVDTRRLLLLLTDKQAQTVRKVLKLFRPGAVPDTIDHKAGQLAEVVNDGGKDSSAGRGHEFRGYVFGIDARAPKQIRCSGSGNRIYAMLTVNESSADIDGRTDESIDGQRIEANRCAHCIDNRIDRAHFMELHIFRRDVMDVSLRN